MTVLVLADRFTIAGLGAELATNLGVGHRQTLVVGLSIVAVVTATIVVTVGMLPFLGLVVPNLVTRFVGGNARRSGPWVALVGAALVLACDLVARTIRYPYELPIGTVLGVVGGTLRILPESVGGPPWVGVSFVATAIVLATYAVVAQHVFLAADVAGRAVRWSLLAGIGIVAYVVGLYAQDLSGRNGVPVRDDRTRHTISGN